MAENQSRPPHSWENGWVPDTSRTPGTRRLYLAGALAVATMIGCVAAIAWTGKDPDPTSIPLADSPLPGLGSYDVPSDVATTPPQGKSGLTTSDTASPSPSRSDSTPTPATKFPSPSASSPTPKAPAVTWRSVRSTNYPDRYWHVSGGSVKLDPVSGTASREDSTFKLVKGLANNSCYSFVTQDGRYLRHLNFILVANTNDGTSLFRQDATFCPRTSSVSGAIMLESVNYPGRYLRHKNFQVRLDSYQSGSTYRADSAFRLVEGLA